MHEMKHALKKRKGLSIEIIVAGPHEVGAPKEQERLEDEAQLQSHDRQLNPEHEVYMVGNEQGEEEKERMHEEMVGKMSDNDKEDLMARKPRSLMERARQHVMKKKK